MIHEVRTKVAPSIKSWDIQRIVKIRVKETGTLVVLRIEADSNGLCFIRMYIDF